MFYKLTFDKLSFFGAFYERAYERREAILNWSLRDKLLAKVSIHEANEARTDTLCGYTDTTICAKDSIVELLTKAHI